MSIIDTLITNRTQADVDALQALYAKPKAMWTAEEWDRFLLGNYRGAYNASDMNRVLDALDYLAQRVTEFGYRKPEIKRPSITEKVVVEGTSRLPEGYTELEYIRSTGTQYINSGVAATDNIKIETKLNMSEVIGYTVLGYYVSETDCWRLFNYNNQFYFDCGTAKNRIYDGTWSLNTNYELEIGNHYVKDLSTGETLVSGTAKTATYSGQGICVFGNNNFAKGKIYYLKIYDNGTLARDYVPCLNASNEVGLYDLVTKTFFGNAGTGYFLPGPVVSLPDGYTRLEYIRSDGDQYINTLFYPNQNARLVMDVQFPNTTPGWLFGARNEMDVTSFSLVATSAKVYRDDFGSDQISYSTNIANRFLLDKNRNITYFDGTARFTHAAATFQTAYQLYLFNLNAAGTVNIGATAELYLCQIYDNDALIRLYTPVLTESGEVGLYDSITGEFYGNEGTGHFMAGSVLSLPEGFSRLEYIAGDASSYINSNILATNNTKIDAKTDASSGKTYFSATGGGYRFGLYFINDGSIDFAFGSSGYKGDAITGLTYPATISMENALISGEGKTYTFAEQSAFTVTQPIVLFGQNNNGTITPTVGKCYFCHFYESGVPSKLFTPAINAEGEIGMYEPISKEFYKNAGTGSFVAGAELDSDTGGTTDSVQTIIRDYYAIGDRPPVSELAEYLANVARMRRVLELPAGVPAVPEDISKRITIEDANHIELILTAVEVLLNRIALSWVYSGEFTAGEV